MQDRTGRYIVRQVTCSGGKRGVQTTHKLVATGRNRLALFRGTPAVRDAGRREREEREGKGRTGAGRPKGHGARQDPPKG